MIQKAVYSLWTTPSGNILNYARNWDSPKSQLEFFSLSVLKSASQFDKVELVTDMHGADVIEKLDLPFTSIRTDLEEIPASYNQLWALGKVYAYKAQDEPFVHIDNDAAFFKPLDSSYLKADLLVQSIEIDNWFKAEYANRIRIVDKYFKTFPKEWEKLEYAFNCGVFGGNDLEFIQKYCNAALDFVHKNNWKAITFAGRYCILFEQYVLSCLAKEYEIEPTYISKNLDEAELLSLGYTHLMAAKKNKTVTDRISERLLGDYPGVSRKITKLLRHGT